VSTLTRSTSCNGTLGPARPCWSAERKRSGSFTLASCRVSQHVREPKCPVGNDVSEPQSEWARLSRRLKLAFLRSSLVTSEHPAGTCLAELTTCEHAMLRDELFSLGQWKANQYTRTLLLDGGSFNVMLLCWAPGCASPVHGHSCAETMIPSNCFLMVLEGSLVETIYTNDAILSDGKSVDARAGKHTALHAGAVAYINDNIGLHKVENQSKARAVSLHVYAPGWRRPPMFDEIFPEVDAEGAEFDCGWGDF